MPKMLDNAHVLNFGHKNKAKVVACVPSRKRFGQETLSDNTQCVFNGASCRKEKKNEASSTKTTLLISLI